MNFRLTFLAVLALAPTVALAADAGPPPLPESVTITLSKDEISGMMQMLDMVTKAYGLQIAGNAVFMAQKIQAAVTTAQHPPPVTATTPGGSK